MVDRKTGRERAAERSYRGLGTGATTEVAKLVKRAPRFEQLVTAIEGGETEVSEAQREFLDDFRAELKGAGGGDDK